ncbi:RNA polymerase subunit sigma [Eubacteriales bacterium OttesenSCG-928-N13]|nr:RNA polymerase subunit sigma [Eubacteriales bacterium OttesenSCG-928-N13]
MDELTLRLALAKTDNVELGKLITDYMPFIKSEVTKTPVFSLDYDDRLSVAMLVFMTCARNYEESRGAFLPFAAVCIRNRLIDEGKKHQRHQGKVIPLYPQEEHCIENSASMSAYSAEQERVSLAEEIDRLSVQLSRFGVTLGSIAEICPKQKRSRALCVRLARETAKHEKLKSTLLNHQRLSVAELARRLAVSEKTVEKHRKYIVTIALVLSGDYPGIQAFLPDTERGEVT